MSRRGAAASLGVCALIVAGAILVALLTGGGGHSTRIVVSDSGCGFDWVAPHSGRTVFTVQNTTPKTIYSVALVGADQSSIYGQIEALAPSTEVPLDVVLPPGEYSFLCQTKSGYTLVSPSREVTGPPVADAHPYKPVDPQQIDFAMLDYRASLLPVLRRLVADTDRLATAVHAGKLAEARTLWLPAHLDYAKLGVAYDTFGPFNDLINGRPLGLAGGVHDPKFQGFLRLEYGLWHGQAAATLDPVAERLDASVHGLLKQFPKLAIPSGDLTLRAHEILENTLQFEFTGETDEGSNTNLATAWSNVKGTGLALTALHSVLNNANPELLASTTAQLGRLGRMLESYKRPDGRWVPLQSLTIDQRERLDGALSGLLEQLDLIPDQLQPAPTGGNDD
ncbi:MAG TPA: EfeM/EfeO family lipoprotein [Gaiellaceae bacterium]|nr:EfeM/EfeO family lipoprotein [Gaiellaceae bacterium]